MSKRREKRITMPLAVRIWGLDRDGKLFSQKARTLNITSDGARLHGVTAKLEPGFVIGMECNGMKARFSVVWTGEPGSMREDQIGVRLVDTGIWGVALPKAVGDEFSAWFEEMVLSTQT